MQHVGMIPSDDSAL